MCHEAGQSTFLHTYIRIYLRILIISYLATFLGTNSLPVLMCRKAVNQSINQCTVTAVVGEYGKTELNPLWDPKPVELTE